MTGRRTYEVRFTRDGQAAIERVRDKKLAAELLGVIAGLAERPDEQGKALGEPLDGVRSVRAARSRYRILYEVDDEGGVVYVLFLGPRRPGETRDVYALAKRLGGVLRAR